MRDARAGKPAKVDALRKIIDEAAARAARLHIAFDRSRLPGRKRDLFNVARMLCPELDGVSEASLEEYMRDLSCRFGPSSTATAPDAYRLLFPECFSPPPTATRS